MDAYLSRHGYHFSKAMFTWAVSMMEDRNGDPARLVDKERVDQILSANNVTVKNKTGYYDVAYVYNMARNDYFGSSITDEAHLSKFVKDYLDDKDGSKTRAFDEFYAKTIALGIDIPWADMI